MELSSFGLVISASDLTGASMVSGRNILFLIAGALCAVVAIIAYQSYQDHREPKGVQLNIGPNGVSVEKK
jgi:hypothetical protein